MEGNERSGGGGRESQRERVDEVCEREVVRCKGEESGWKMFVCVERVMWEALREKRE